MRRGFWFMLVFVLALAGCTGGTGGVPETGGEAGPTAVVETLTAAPTLLAATSAPVVSPQAPPAATSAPAVAATTAPQATAPSTCEPTEADMLGPFYTPGAPQRTAVGQGYVLEGVVRSAAGCGPVSGALIEFWMAGPDGVYTDDYRASQMVGADGAYRFESHFPPPYSGRPAHIHIKVSAPGFAELVTQHYPVEGVNQAGFDLVMRPQ